jgi:hypothetical protein
MNINRMKLGLVYIFSENEKLSKEAKLQLIKFIEMADEQQIKILAMDGEVIDKSSLDETARSIVDDRFKSSLVTETLEKSSIEAVYFLLEYGDVAFAAGVGVAAGGGMYAAYRVTAGRKCKKLFPKKGDERRKTCVKDYMSRHKSSAGYKAYDKKKAADKKAKMDKMKKGLK